MFTSVDKSTLTLKLDKMFYIFLGWCFTIKTISATLSTPFSSPFHHLVGHHKVYSTGAIPLAIPQDLEFIL